MHACLRPVARLIVLTAVLVGVAAAPALAADAPFTSRFAATAPGNIAAVGNVLMTCPTAATNCVAARAGTATGAALNNNSYDMVRYKLAEDAGDASIFDSSKATVTLPAGASVLWAGLYWSADTSAGTNGAAAADTTAAGMAAVRFAVPGGSGYTTLTAAAGDVLTSSVQPSRYRSFRDVTSLVQNAGGGEYKVANVQAGTGQDRYAGWSLMVAYRDAAQPMRRLSVYDGLGTVDNTHTFSTPITPFHTPASGLVKSRIGMLSFEGDAGYTGETARFNGHDLSDGLNPVNNAMNSTIETGGVSFTAKVPDQRNQLNVDLDTFVDDAGLYLSNDQSSATLTFSSTVEYFMPSALFLVADEGPATNSLAPSISGTATDGRTLTADKGTWNGTPTITYGYQWERCDAAGANCADIAGATGSTYALTSADVGKKVDVVVKATNDAGVSDPATSAKTAAVAPALPANTVVPTIAGVLTDGRTLTADKGTWTGTPTVTYGYQWQRCDANGANCVDIAGATNTTYALTSADVAGKLRIAVKGTNAAGTSAAAYSAPTAGVAPLAAADTAVPTVSGTFVDGNTLTAAPGTWTGSTPMTFAYQWQRCDTNGANCVDIVGATSQTYALTSTDVAKRVRVTVKATNAAGTTAAVPSAATTVSPAPAVNTVLPTITGTQRDGQTLTAAPGTWTGTLTVTYTYQWQRCDAAGANCADIAGAGATTYTLTSTDITKRIRVAVKGTNAAGTSTAVSSVTTGAIAAIPVANTVAPTITGTLTDGRTLTANRGTWTGSPTITYAYQWRRCDGAGANCVDVAGATASTYILTSTDVAKTLKVGVTGANDAGALPVTTAATVAVAAVPAANSGVPTVSGTARDGQTLTAAPGTWTGSTPIAYAYQWQRCDATGANCVDIAGATGATYALTPADVGAKVRVAVKGTNAAGTSVAVASSVTAVVAAIPAANTVAPAVTGILTDGQALTANKGTWTGTAPITYGYQWQRCNADGTGCVDIAGATNATYPLTGDDVTRKIRVSVTGTNAAGTSTPVSSAVSATTVAGVPVANTLAPAVTGTPQDGETLTAGTGTWTGTQPIGLTYQWQRCDAAGANCTDIAGATSQTYVLTPTDVGRKVRVAVKATNVVDNVTVNAAPTATVVIAPPANVVRPTVTGPASEGGVLTAATRGTWTGTAPLGYATQWQRCDAAGANCVDVAGATGTTYTLTASDVGSTFRTQVTATNAAPQNAVATSVPSSVVTVAPPVNVVVPTVSGAPAIGATLTAATRGTWTGGQPMTFAYQWLRCAADGTGCVDIAGAGAATYPLTSADANARLRVRVTATNAAGSARAASVPSDAVAAAATNALMPPVNLVIPSVPATLTPGAPLDAGDGTWGGSPANKTYQWHRCDEGGANCVAIPGATGATYTPGVADAGRTLRVAVTATNAVGTATALSGIVAAPDLSAVAGVLVSDTDCQQLAGGAKFARVKVEGVGNVRVRAYTSGPALKASPVRLTTQITGGSARAVTYRLDGRALAAKPDRMHRSTITPAQLRRVGTHTILATVRGTAGKARTIKLTVRTVPCQTLFTAQRWNTTAGTGLRLRVDARSALSTVAFKVPGALLPRPVRKARPIGFVRLYVAGKAKPVRHALTLPARGRSGVLLDAAGWPTVLRTASGISVTGLPAGTAVAELTLYRVRTLDRPTSTRRYGMSAQIQRAGAARQVLRQKPAAPKA